MLLLPDEVGLGEPSLHLCVNLGRIVQPEDVNLVQRDECEPELALALRFAAREVILQLSVAAEVKLVSIREGPSAVPARP